MTTQKRVSFGCKDSLVETWIIDDADVTRKKCGDVREIWSGFYDDDDDDTMTSASDIVVASTKSTNQKMADKHVTIGDSTFVVMTPEDNSAGSSPNGVQTAQLQSNHNHHHHADDDSTTTSSATIVTANNTTTTTTATTTTTTSTSNNGNNSSDNSAVIAPSTHEQHTSSSHGASDTETHEPRKDVASSQRRRSALEEYYDVLNPQPKDQSLESRDNPFLPGGDLSREAEDLLSRATIIRDNFYLNEEEKRTLQLQQQQEQLL
ncbi:uncharacterized protein YGR130C-like, partial [Aplysia californica]|uniref:Uncharacterized protein YGR130C-like n=1 Tax=Aplysia californica TaxID=6500 RepID=A0ABM1W328_APLCA